jgi:ABC-type sugar transport system ATPase subunit
MSVSHNVNLAALGKFCRGGLIDRAAENDATDRQIRALSIKTPGRNCQVQYLSGGNQQKVVIAKALLTEPEILILDEPTRGIDIGAKAEVHAIMRRLARQGKAIIMVSSEMAEIMSLSDRILVMREGRIAAELSGPHANPEQIMKYAMLN